MLKLNIKFTDGEVKSITHTGNKTFYEWTTHFFSARYFTLHEKDEAGNMTIDTDKVKYIERQ